ncbi:MAG TPA: VOC family protein [Polyangiales bacterium]|nr:VOC family protein [Polyangiales bacterium]
MHRSRLSTLFIDCPSDSFEAGSSFWSGALGKELLVSPNNERYRTLRGRVGGAGGPIVGLQRVPDEERAVHLDIETDDIEAEVKRLERLGATIKARIRNHVVMVAPSGHPFCVVNVHRPDFEAASTLWPDD